LNQGVFGVNTRANMKHCIVLAARDVQNHEISILPTWDCQVKKLPKNFKNRRKGDYLDDFRKFLGSRLYGPLLVKNFQAVVSDTQSRSDFKIMNYAGNVIYENLEDIVLYDEETVELYKSIMAVIDNPSYGGLQYGRELKCLSEYDYNLQMFIELNCDFEVKKEKSNQIRSGLYVELKTVMDYSKSITKRKKDSEDLYFGLRRPIILGPEDETIWDWSGIAGKGSNALLIGSWPENIVFNNDVSLGPTNNVLNQSKIRGVDLEKDSINETFHSFAVKTVEQTLENEDIDVLISRTGTESFTEKYGLLFKFIEIIVTSTASLTPRFCFILSEQLMSIIKDEFTDEAFEILRKAARSHMSDSGKSSLYPDARISIVYFENSMVGNLRKLVVLSGPLPSDRTDFDGMNYIYIEDAKSSLSHLEVLLEKLSVLDPGVINDSMRKFDTRIHDESEVRKKTPFVPIDSFSSFRYWTGFGMGLDINRVSVHATERRLEEMFPASSTYGGEVCGCEATRLDLKNSDKDSIFLSSWLPSDSKGQIFVITLTQEYKRDLLSANIYMKLSTLENRYKISHATTVYRNLSVGENFDIGTLQIFRKKSYWYVSIPFDALRNMSCNEVLKLTDWDIFCKHSLYLRIYNKDFMEIDFIACDLIAIYCLSLNSNNENTIMRMLTNNRVFGIMIFGLPKVVNYSNIFLEESDVNGRIRTYEERPFPLDVMLRLQFRGAIYSMRTLAAVSYDHRYCSKEHGIYVFERITDYGGNWNSVSFTGSRSTSISDIILREEVKDELFIYAYARNVLCPSLDGLRLYMISKEWAASFYQLNSLTIAKIKHNTPASDKCPNANCKNSNYSCRIINSKGGPKRFISVSGHLMRLLLLCETYPIRITSYIMFIQDNIAKNCRTMLTDGYYSSIFGRNAPSVNLTNSRLQRQSLSYVGIGLWHNVSEWKAAVMAAFYFRFYHQIKTLESLSDQFVETAGDVDKMRRLLEFISLRDETSVTETSLLKLFIEVLRYFNYSTTNRRASFYGIEMLEIAGNVCPDSANI